MQTELIHTSKKKKWMIIGIIALLIIIVAINITVMQSKKNGIAENLKFASVAEKEIKNTKLIAGVVKPENTETIYAEPAKGKIKEIFVKEGQKITKGQKLFSYDNPELIIQNKQIDIDKKLAQIHYDQSTAKISSLKKEIQKAQDANAPKEVTDPLESQLQDLQFQQKTTELEMEKNKLQEDELQSKQNELTVLSSTDGTVQKIDTNAQQNSVQTAGSQTSAIIQIVSNNPFEIQGTLTELQKSQIQPNQAITLTSKAVSNKIWKGKITEISEYPTSDEAGQSMMGTTGQQTQNISYYNFKATLDSQDGLSPGYHVSIQANVASHKILAVPSSSIIEKGASRFVYVVKDNKVSKQKITTGTGDGEWTEVLDGLKAGEKVVKNPSANVYVGLEVKVK